MCVLFIGCMRARVLTTCACVRMPLPVPVQMPSALDGSQRKRNRWGDGLDEPDAGTYAHTHTDPYTWTLKHIHAVMHVHPPLLKCLGIMIALSMSQMPGHNDCIVDVSMLGLSVFSAFCVCIYRLTTFFCLFGVCHVCIHRLTTLSTHEARVQALQDAPKFASCVRRMECCDSAAKHF